MSSLNLMTHSRAKTSRSCARKHQIEYLLLYRPVGNAEELDFGTIVHACLAVWWALAVPGIPVIDRLNAAITRLDAVPKLDGFVRARIEVMLVGYHARWVNEPLYVVAVEQEFRSPLVNPVSGVASKLWELGGKLDVVVFNFETQTKWLMEHKTSGEDLSPGSTYHRRLRMDPQVSIYFDGAAALGHEIVGCIYDVLAKPKLKPLQATPLEARKFTKKTGELYSGQRLEDETVTEFSNRLVLSYQEDPTRFFARIEVPRLEAELNDARSDLWQQAQRMRDDERLGRHPRNPDACTMYGRVCSYFDVCTGAGSLDDQRLYRRATSAHEELATT